MIEKYVLEVNTDHETGEEHCTVLKTDGTTDMNNWITIINAMYTHHSILEPLVNELNKIYNGYSDTEKYAIKLWKENQQLKQQLQKIQNSFEFNCTQNYVDFNKDKLYIKDNNTKIRLDGTNLFIEVYIPQIDEYNRFKYMVTGRRLMNGFIEKYNLNGDEE